MRVFGRGARGIRSCQGNVLAPAPTSVAGAPLRSDAFATASQPPSGGSNRGMWEGVPAPTGHRAQLLAPAPSWGCTCPGMRATGAQGWTCWAVIREGARRKAPPRSPPPCLHPVGGWGPGDARFKKHPGPRCPVMGDDAPVMGDRPATGFTLGRASRSPARGRAALVTHHIQDTRDTPRQGGCSRPLPPRGGFAPRERLRVCGVGAGGHRWNGGTVIKWVGIGDSALSPTRRWMGPGKLASSKCPWARGESPALA